LSWFGISRTLFNFSRQVYSKCQPGYSINPTHIPPDYSTTSTHGLQPKDMRVYYFSNADRVIQ
jgi:hypothetical protein